MAIEAQCGTAAAYAEEADQWLRANTPRPESGPEQARRRREIEIKRRIDLRLATPRGAWWSASPPLPPGCTPCEPGDARLSSLGQ